MSTRESVQAGIAPPDDHFPDVETFGDHRFALLSLPNRDRSDFYPFVLFDDKNLLAVRADLNRPPTERRPRRAGRERQRDIDKLPGPERNSEFLNSALSLIVPVVRSTALSTKASAPCSGRPSSD